MDIERLELLRGVGMRHANHQGWSHLAEDFGSFLVERALSGDSTNFPMQWMFCLFMRDWLGTDDSQPGQVRWNAGFMKDLGQYRNLPADTIDHELIEAAATIERLGVDPVDRACFLLNIYFEWKIEAIAALIGGSWSGVQLRIDRVKNELKRGNRCKGKTL